MGFEHEIRGWKFPVGPDPSTGRMRMSTGIDDIRESVRIILFTNLGERIMEPNFGSDIRKYVFSPSSDGTYALLGAEIQRAIMEWEPRVKDVSVDIRPSKDGEAVRVDVNLAKVTDDEMLRLSYDIELNI